MNSQEAWLSPSHPDKDSKARNREINRINSEMNIIDAMEHINVSIAYVLLNRFNGWIKAIEERSKTTQTPWEDGVKIEKLRARLSFVNWNDPDRVVIDQSNKSKEVKNTPPTVKGALNLRQLKTFLKKNAIQFTEGPIDKGRVQITFPNGNTLTYKSIGTYNLSAGIINGKLNGPNLRRAA